MNERMNERVTNTLNQQANESKEKMKETVYYIHYQVINIYYTNSLQINV